MKKYLKKINTFLILTCLIVPQFTIAQIDMTDVVPEEAPAQDFRMPTNLALCSDYFNVSDIQIDIDSDFVSYAPLDPVLLTGTIKNTRAYPIVGFDVVARVVREVFEGDDIVAEIIFDEFTIASNVSLAGSKERELSYSHLLPGNAVSGEYKIHIYIVEQNNLDTKNIPSSTFIPHTQISFEVEGENPDQLYFDQAEIMIGERGYDMADFEAVVSADSQIPVSIPLYNPTSESKLVRVAYDLYTRDTTAPQNRIKNTSFEEITIPADSEVLVEYIIEDLGLVPRYYLSITAEAIDPELDSSVYNEKSITNIILNIENRSLPQINFVGTDQYPLKRGKQTNLITCFNLVGNQQDQSPIKVETTIYDSNNKQIAQTIYEGPLSLFSTAYAQTFVPRTSTSEFKIVSKIYNAQGDILDQVEKSYACADIDESLCTQSGTLTLGTYVAMALTLLVLLFVILILKRKRFNITRV